MGKPQRLDRERVNLPITPIPDFLFHVILVCKMFTVKNFNCSLYYKKFGLLTLNFDFWLVFKALENRLPRGWVKSLKTPGGG